MVGIYHEIDQTPLFEIGGVYIKNIINYKNICKKQG